MRRGYKNYRYQYEESIAIDKDKINELFKLLRKNGIVARQNFMCCQGCAGAALTDKYGDNKKVVYYTSQDNATLKKYGELYLAYGLTNCTIDGAEQELGNLIVNLAKDLSLNVDWSGDINERILIKF